ncbi:regulator of eph expression [Anticarsia gemmatalis]|uniref:regulator of eph expression n=1 Tax=Anticarsia gemmatalis TaxID=129554 RepID=UPI003F759A97
MLKFLTHKLRTHSLNEESVSEKVEERDSGTESDDEAERADPGDFCTDVIMKWNDVTDISMGGEACACAPTPPRLLPDPEPDHLYDHHSSEEELEVINGAPVGAAGAGGAAGAAAAESRRRGASSPPPAAPEKRKWPAQPYLDADELAARAPSSDDDDTKVETPVRFRTSPPLEALKPRRAGACACAGGVGATVGGAGSAGVQALAGAAGVSAGVTERAPLSPRRRRMPLPPPRRHRPALDFDKMQQLKVGGGGVRSWRAVGGAHGGELSVFCW